MEIKNIHPLWGAAAVGSTVAALYLFYKNHKIAKKLNTTMEKLENMTVVDISNAVVDAAIDKKVDAAVTYSVTALLNKKQSDIERKITSEVNSSLEECYLDAKANIRKTVKDKVSALDSHTIKEDIIQMAKDTLSDRLDSDLDDARDKYSEALDEIKDSAKEEIETITNEFSENLKQIRKIYNSVAGSLDSSDGIKLKVV